MAGRNKEAARWLGMCMERKLVTQEQVLDSEFFANLRDPEVWKDPHPTYHRLRFEAPQWHDEQFGEWVFTRYEDCMAVLRDPRWSSNPDHLAQKRSFEEASFRVRQAMSDLKVLLFMDPPDHTRLRGLVSKAFTPRSVERLRPRIGQIVDGLLDDLGEKGEFDLVSELAFLAPVTVICEKSAQPLEKSAAPVKPAPAPAAPAPVASPQEHEAPPPAPISVDALLAQIKRREAPSAEQIGRTLRSLLPLLNLANRQYKLNIDDALESLTEQLSKK